MRERLYAPGALLFGPGAGCPNATDLARGRRPGTPAHLKFQLGSGQLARHIGPALAVGGGVGVEHQ